MGKPKYRKVDWEVQPITTDLMSSITTDIDELKRLLNNKVTLVHNCQNCGARLEIEEKHPVFHCKYCGSTYIIGALQTKSTY